MSQSSELGEQELVDIEEKAKPESTKKATLYGINKFTEWIEKRAKSVDFHSISGPDLNEILRKFYAEVKSKKAGQSLSPSTLSAIRAAIHRHITSSPFFRNINIIKGDDFVSANHMFVARCKLYFRQGNPKPQHKKAIEKGDLEKLGQYFTNWKNNPDILLESCWFFLCFYFGRRGREGWSALTKDSFSPEVDSEGNEFITMKKTEITKNHQGGFKQGDQGYSNEKMYGPGVSIFKFYLSKLNPNNTRLFQHPLKSYKFDDFWYRNEPIGKNTICNMMQRISKKAGLSNIYTCHSVRASTITTLYQAGISPQSIIAITKHKNVASLGHYIADLSDDQKRDCSAILTATLNLPESVKLNQPSSTVSKVPAVPTFDIGFPIQLSGEDEEKQETAELTVATNTDVNLQLATSDQNEFDQDGDRIISLVPVDDVVTIPAPAPGQMQTYTIQPPNKQPTSQPAQMSNHNMQQPGLPLNSVQNIISNTTSHGMFPYFHNCTFNINN